MSAVCNLCGNAAKLVCQRCGDSYCNEVCQRDDWPRHRYFCTTMPPLVANAKLQMAAKQPAERMVEKSAPSQAKNEVVESKLSYDMRSLALDDSEKSSYSAVIADAAQSPEMKKLSSLWREHFVPPESEFFECRVSFIEENGSIWVVDNANTERLERLTDNMARCLQRLKPCTFNDLAVHGLVGIVFNDKVYRGEVTALYADTEQAEVRLIDIGVSVTSAIQDIFAPMLRMAELKSFALHVKLPTNTGVQINKNLSLRLLGTKTRDGAYQAQLKPKMTIPLQLPLQMLAIHPEVTVVKIFEKGATPKEPPMALLQINCLNNLNTDLNVALGEKASPPYTGPFPEESRTFFVSARTNQGYRRAFLLDFIEKPTPTFLVYEMDEGRITITNELRRIPSELLGHPLRVFAITLADGQLRSLYDELEKAGRDLSIKFKADNLSEKNTFRTATASLIAGNEQVCSVRAMTFQGQVADLGIKYWREPIQSGSAVYITSVASYDEICIGFLQAKQYAEILKSLDHKCKPFSESAEIPIGCIVLVACPTLGHFRGEVTAVTERGLYNVLNIDTGVTHEVAAKRLRMPCRFIENMPVSIMRTKLKIVCDVPSAAVPPKNAALEWLQKLCAKKEEFFVDFTGTNPSSVDLLSASGEQRSVVQRMLPLIFISRSAQPVAEPPTIAEPKKMSTQASASMPPSPPNSPLAEDCKNIERYYFSDLQKVLIPLGKSINVIVLNALGLHETGYITGCCFQNEKVAENFQNLLNLVGHHGQCTHNELSGYMPGVGEMCLALFSEDGGWYRGVCLEICGNRARIFYCDFGNSEMVVLNKMKPIPNDLLHPVYATKCFINGYDKTKNFKLLEEYLLRKSKVPCTVQEGPEPNSRLLTVPNLNKILSKEAS